MIYQVYSIGTGAISLAASASSTGGVNIQFPTTGDFIVDRLTGSVLQSSLVVSNWGGTVRITFPNGEMAWMADSVIPFVALVGDAKTPFPVDPPVRIKKGSTVRVDFVNSVVGTATVVNLVFVGNLEIL